MKVRLAKKIMRSYNIYWSDKVYKTCIEDNFWYPEPMDYRVIKALNLRMKKFKE